MKIRNLYRGKLKYWYEQNYTYLHTLYPAWLSDTLSSLMEKDKHYSILSPSANKGWHEEDAYKALCELGYEVDFTVADILGEEYYKHKKDYQCFHFLHRNLPVQEMDTKHSYDIIMDCKGAMWYALHSRNKRNKHVVQLLSTYEKLLKDDASILLVDGYQKQRYSTFMNHLISLFHLPIDKFREDSTLSLFHHVFTSYSSIDFHSIPMQTLDEEKQTSIRQMYMVYLTRREITLLKEEIQTEHRRAYLFSLKRSCS